MSRLPQSQTAFQRVGWRHGDAPGRPAQAAGRLPVTNSACCGKARSYPGSVPQAGQAGRRPRARARRRAVPIYARGA
eukprot:5823887-Lingulodinium_polyedra.AAC.1